MSISLLSRTTNSNINMGLLENLITGIQEAIAWFFGQLGAQFLRLYTTLLEYIVLPLITATPMPRAEAEVPPFTYPRPSETTGSTPLTNAASCSSYHPADSLALSECQMWSELFYNVYISDVVPVSIAMLVLFYAFTVGVKSTGLSKSGFIRGGGGTASKGYARINEKFFNALVGILFWWPIGLTILYIANLFTAAMAGMYDLEAFLSNSPNPELQGLASIPILLILIQGAITYLVVALFWMLRYVVLIALTIMMPIVIVLWTLDIGPFSSIADMASKTIRIYVLLAFAPIPAGIFLAMAQVSPSLIDSLVTLAGGSELAASMLRTLAYMAIPISASIIPFYMFKDVLTDDLMDVLGPIGDIIGDKIGLAMDSDKMQEKAREAKSGAMSALTGKSYEYDEEAGMLGRGKLVQSDEPGAGSQRGLQLREYAGSATSRMRGLGNRTRSAAATGGIASYAAWQDFKRSENNREAIRRIGETTRERVEEEGWDRTKETVKGGIERGYESIIEAEEDTTSLSVALASKAAQQPENIADSSAAALGGTMDALSNAEAIRDNLQDADIEEIEASWTEESVDTAEEYDVHPLMARARGEEMMLGVSKSGANEERVKNEFEAELDESVEIDTLVGEINNGNEREAYKELLIGQYGKDEDVFNDDRKDWVADETSKSRVELTQMSEDEAMFEMLASNTSEDYEDWLTEAGVLDPDEMRDMDDGEVFREYTDSRYGGLESFVSESRHMSEEDIDNAEDDVELMETYVNNHHGKSRTDYTNKLVPDSVDMDEHDWSSHVDSNVDSFDELSENEQLKAVSEIEDEELDPEDQIDPSKVSEMIEEKGDLTDEDIEELTEEGFEDLVEMGEGTPSPEEIMTELELAAVDLPDDFDELSESEKLVAVAEQSDTLDEGEIEDAEWLDDDEVEEVKEDVGLDEWDEELLVGDESTLEQISEELEDRVDDEDADASS